MTPITTPIFVPCPEPMESHERGCYWQQVRFPEVGYEWCSVCAASLRGSDALQLQNNAYGPVEESRVCLPCARDIANAVIAIDTWAAKRAIDRALAVPDAIVEQVNAILDPATEAAAYTELAEAEREGRDAEYEAGRDYEERAKQ